MDKRAIGVFDSGLGGLTVVKAIRQVLPHESVIYIGDTARVPYGTRSAETIKQFALEVTQRLMREKVKVVLVACNTISALALPEIRKLVKVPVLGVIEPTVKRALETTHTKRIAVVGTTATIGSGVYQIMIKHLDPEVQVTAKATPLLVPIVEEGLWQHPVAKLMVEEYLQFVKDNHQIDTLILGCTHYPVLTSVMENYLGKGVLVVDSARPTAEVLKRLLKENNLMADGAKPVELLFTSDNPSKSGKLAEALLGERVELKQISL